MSITITDEMVDVAMAAGLGPRSPFVFDPVYVGFDLRAALATAAPLIEAAVRERCAQAMDHLTEEQREQIDAEASTMFREWSRVGVRGQVVRSEDNLSHWTVNATVKVFAAAIRADGGAE
jgi:hypothetical protein